LQQKRLHKQDVPQWLEHLWQHDEANKKQFIQEHYHLNIHV